MKNRILILTPFRNEEVTVPHYLKSLLALDYSHKLIDLCWLENDSSDGTYELLLEASKNSEFKNFRSISLKQVSILGKVDKRKPGEYTKDIPYSDSRRIESWLVLWNEYFLPTMNSTDVDFSLMWFADCVASTNVIEEYLRVFKEKQDAGWVGGVMYRRHPRENELISPWDRFWKEGIPKDIMEVPFASTHCWLSKTGSLKGMSVKYLHDDIHVSIIEQLKEKGLLVYCQPSVYLKHVSTNGQIYSKAK